MKRSIVRILLSVLVTSPIVLLVGSSPAEALSVDAGYIEVEDGRIFYEATGSGPAIIMIHDGILQRETILGSQPPEMKLRKTKLKCCLTQTPIT